MPEPAYNPIVGQISAAQLTCEEEPERWIIALVVTIVAQLMQAGFKIRLVIAQFECRQHAAIIGTVAAIMEQRNVPVGAKGMQELQQGTGDSGNSKLNKRSCSGCDGRPPTI